MYENEHKAYFGRQFSLNKSLITKAFRKASSFYSQEKKSKG